MKAKFEIQPKYGICVVIPDPENVGFFIAEVWGEACTVTVRARDPVRAEGMAWREYGQRLIDRTKTIAYKAAHEDPDGYVP